jgi:hypothetical protein
VARPHRALACGPDDRPSPIGVRAALVSARRDAGRVGAAMAWCRQHATQATAQELCSIPTNYRTKFRI